jgi:hypothetical protein
MRLGCAVRVRVSGLYPLSGVYQSAAIQSLSLLHLAGVTEAWPLLSRAQGRLSKRRGSGAAMWAAWTHGRESKGTLTVQANVDSLAADALELDHDLCQARSDGALYNSEAVALILTTSQGRAPAR